MRQLKITKQVTNRETASLDKYLQEIGKVDLITADEEVELAQRIKAGDQRALEKLTKANLRFVVSVAKQYQNQGLTLPDLINEGNLGLIKAAQRFDETRGFKFISYAVWWIRQSIYNSIYWQAREIRLPMSQQLLVISILDATNKFLQSHDRNPSSEEISEMTDIPREQIDYLAQFSNKLVSVDDFIGGDEENSQVCDIIPDGEDPLDEQVNKSYVTKELENLLSKLTIREHDLICMLFGIGMAPVNPKIIADMYGVGGERIRQMKEGALAKLRRRFSNQLKNLM